MTIAEFYKNNTRFKGYVDRYHASLASGGRTIGDVLSLALVREVARYYLAEEQGAAGRKPAINSTYAPMGECI